MNSTTKNKKLPKPVRTARIHRAPTNMGPSPVEALRATLPKGDTPWNTGAEGYVWCQLQNAALKMGESSTEHLSDFHVMTMAVMGTGHEETMKYHMALCRSYGWI